jgi:hypothetical protein
LSLPLHWGALQAPPATVPTSATRSWIRRIKNIQAPARAIDAHPILQACRKCGQVRLRPELTTGGYCYQCAFARGVAPGIWEDSDGGVHFDVPSLLALFEIPDTPDNREQVLQTVQGVLTREMPAALHHIRRSISDAN